MTRHERIKQEEARLTKHLAGLPETRRHLVEGLIQRAAFLRVEAEDLEADINERGSTELFQNGPDALPMTRVRAAAQQHDKVVRAYTTICKQLAEMAPEGKASSEQDAFQELMGRKLLRVK